LTVFEPEVASAGNVWYVGSGPSNHSATINGGISLASDGDTVFVYSSTYFENVIVNKTINLTGENRDTTVIDGGEINDVVNVTSDYVNITGFTIANGGHNAKHNGIEAESYNLTISGNIFLNNRYGIYIRLSHSSNINSNIFTNDGGAIYLWNSGDSNINGNIMTQSGGIHLEFSERSNVTNNIVAGTGLGIWLESSNSINVINNTLLENGGGIELDSSNDIIIMGNNASNNTNGVSLTNSPENMVQNNICNFNRAYGIFLFDSSSNDIIGNDASYTADPFLMSIGIMMWSSWAGSDRNEIRDNEVSNNEYGIYLYGVDIMSVSENNITDNLAFSNANWGIGGHYSNRNIIASNTAYDNMHGIYLYSYSDANIISGNDVFNNEIGIHLNTSSSNNTIMDNEVFSNDLGIFASMEANNNTVRNNTVTTNNYVGMRINFWSNRNSIMDNRISSNQVGINISRSSNDNRIIGNDISSNSLEGVGIDDSRGNSIFDNSINNNLNGIVLTTSSSNNVFRSNNISSNTIDGIRVNGASSNMTIARNNISINGAGVSILGSVDNFIHHNNFLSNTIQAFDDTSNNLWNDSYPSGGNFWSDWSPICQDLYDGAVTPQTGGGGSDAICDLQYDIDGDSADYYPLTNPPDTTPPLIFNLQPPDGSTTSDSTPTIGADYWDASGIDVGSVLLELDGVDRTASSVVTSSGVSYIPSMPLINGSHLVYVEVSDIHGNIAFEFWSFTVSLTPRPPHITDLRVVGNEINITWNLSPSSNVEAYDIYSGPTQTSINLNDLLLATPDESPPAQQWWAQFPFDTTANREYYFVVRARSTILQERSVTSNTMGYYRMDFEAGLNTFSLPLKQVLPQSLDVQMLDMGADSISWLDGNDDWQTYPANPSAPMAEMGEGYVVEFPAATSHVFTGEPAAMVLYNDGFGFDNTTRDDISASVNALGDVTVSWTPIAGANLYCVLRSGTRNGFHTESFTSQSVLAPPFLDAGAASAAGELYYIVVPSELTDCDGSSTYSIGVITEEYSGNEMFGLPLKPNWGDRSADWYADQITNVLGIVYLDDGTWKAHFKEFPEGVYDTTVVLGKGYELTVFTMVKYSYIGW
jgi:parallel beta-helix repeat protein